MTDDKPTTPVGAALGEMRRRREGIPRQVRAIVHLPMSDADLAALADKLGKDPARIRRIADQLERDAIVQDRLAAGGRHDTTAAHRQEAARNRARAADLRRWADANSAGADLAANVAAAVSQMTVLRPDRARAWAQAIAGLPTPAFRQLVDAYQARGKDFLGEVAGLVAFLDGLGNEPADLAAWARDLVDFGETIARDAERQQRLDALPRDAGLVAETVGAMEDDGPDEPPQPVCGFCRAQFDTPADLADHIERSHGPGDRTGQAHRRGA